MPLECRPSVVAHRPISVGHNEEVKRSYREPGVQLPRAQVEVYLEGEEHPRFWLSIIDAAEAARWASACLIVPQGREHEWLFKTMRGLTEVAKSATCSRLIAVRLNGREHSFKSGLNGVQQELGDLVSILSPQGCESIPFLTPGGETLGKRRVRAAGKLASGDRYFVEECEDEEKRPTRRLVFASNPCVVQTEVTLGTKKKKSKQVVDHLTSAYHVSVLAGLVGYCKLSDVCLVGLGGGALATALIRAEPSLRLSIVELDPEIVEVACRWFEFDADRKDTRIDCPRDGLTAFDNDNAHFSAIVIDVDAKQEKHIGVSCPPQAFLRVEYLAKLARATGRDGLVVYNLVARDPDAKRRALDNFSAVFEHVAVLQPNDDDLNHIVFAQKESSYPAGETVRAVRDAAQCWLAQQPAPSDPLGIISHLEKLVDLGPT